MKMKFYINAKTRLNMPFKFLGVILFLSAMSLNAQKKNEVNLYINGPVSILKYDAVDNSAALDNGIGFGLEYGRYLSDNWSLRTGLALQQYSGNAKLNQINGAYATEDSEGESFEFRYQFTNYKERQEASYIQIPLLVQYEGRGASRFFAAGGLKVGILASSEYNSKADLLTTAGYYEQYDALLEGPKFAGFGNFGKYNWGADDLELKTNVMLNLETGLKLSISEVSSFYVSVYIDYGLVNIFDQTSGNRLLEYNENTEVSFTGNSILKSAPGEVEDIKTISFGFKLKYGLGF
ncbi:outer membrane beta-barrel protein [Leeuwenhoekiella sp. NPDC079379]|uniref:outer membrane beta-barrel protein n=1 Tax=Leeuwenhoekiella sp. NPDC079379 TaxID=3364122 RepID=UPI0037C8E80E